MLMDRWLGRGKPMLSEPVAVTLQVVDLLEALGVPYLIGGSFASAIHGVARMTMDTDLVADLRPDHVEPLAQALGGAFYLDAGSIRDAVRHRSSFSVIHLGTMFKVDIFILKQRPYDRVQLERRVKQIVSIDPERTAYVASAEDNILAKLEWYRLGHEVSERQWRDVLGMLSAQMGRLDLAYMKQWAVALGVADLLERALADADQSAGGSGDSSG